MALHGFMLRCRLCTAHWSFLVVSGRLFVFSASELWETACMGRQVKHLAARIDWASFPCHVASWHEISRYKADQRTMRFHLIYSSLKEMCQPKNRIHSCHSLQTGIPLTNISNIQHSTFSFGSNFQQLPTGWNIQLGSAELAELERIFGFLKEDGFILNMRSFHASSKFKGTWSIDNHLPLWNTRASWWSGFVWKLRGKNKLDG